MFSSASYTFVAGDVGAWIYIKSGTNSIPGWYKIASVAGGKATLSAAIGAAVRANGFPTVVLGLATVGTPTNLTWGVDYSQQASPQLTFTDLVIGGTTTQFTSAANPVGKNFVGNIINITSGTGFTAQRVAVVSTSGTTATCDKSLGTGASTGGNGKLGGALLSPAIAASLRVAGNICFVKSGTYSITSASTNVAGGCVSDAAGGAGLAWMGYQAVRGDFGTPPLLQASGISTAVLFTMTAGSTAGAWIVNITVDGGALTSIQGFNFARRGLGLLLKALNCSNIGINAGGGGNILMKCIATGCSGGAAAIVFNSALFCEAYSNTIPGFAAGGSSGFACSGCLSFNNSGASSDGFLISGGGEDSYLNCVAYGNGRDGFRKANAGAEVTQCINCIAESNSGTGFNATSAALGAELVLFNCAAYLNGTNLATVLTGLQSMVITGTASFFVNAASSNFALNANAGGGALLRAAGILGVTPDGLSTGFQDIGAIQSKALATLGIGFEAGMVA